VKHWSDSIIRYRPERQQLFKVFAAEAARIKKAALSVFELGCGPGFLAEALLQNCQIARYTLTNAFPTKWEAPDFDASSNELAIETIEIAHEGLRLITDP